MDWFYGSRTVVDVDGLACLFVCMFVCLYVCRDRGQKSAVRTVWSDSWYSIV